LPYNKLNNIHLLDAQIAFKHSFISEFWTFQFCDFDWDSLNEFNNSLLKIFNILEM